jgi:hypothetical protein
MQEASLNHWLADRVLGRSLQIKGTVPTHQMPVALLAIMLFAPCECGVLPYAWVMTGIPNSVTPQTIGNTLRRMFSFAKRRLSTWLKYRS